MHQRPARRLSWFVVPFAILANRATTFSHYAGYPQAFSPPLAHALRPGGHVTVGCWKPRASHRVARAVQILGFVLLLNLLHFLFVAVLASMVRARHFQNPTTRQLNVRALWASLTVNPVVCSLGVVGLFVGVTACGNLVEIYRTRSGAWHDAALWQLEKGLFAGLLASPLNVPAFWDTVYFMVWSGLFIGSSLLFVTGQKRRFFLLVTALVWAYVLTRVTAIYFPTQGPVFFVPEIFSLSERSAPRRSVCLRSTWRARFPRTGCCQAQWPCRVSTWGCLFW